MAKHRPSKVAKRGSKTAAPSRRDQNSGRDRRVRFSKQADEVVPALAPQPARKEPESPGTPCPPARSTAEAKPKPQARPRPARRRRGQAEMHPDGTATLERVAHPSLQVGETSGMDTAEQHQRQQGPDPEASNLNLDFLRQNPYFPQIRELVRQNRELLEMGLQQVGIEDPRLYNLIKADQARFLGLCFENVVDEPGSAIQGDEPKGNAAQ
ncbi:hypothetical protein PRZ48_005696 [Zasmidium cellare]|uniref:XPC-binding domain-containing protein n=1 Tax=Zasmidium cellare TaxID=395010 RepID=A0ABR0ELX1_ZASCE|nr:hypothetical protein PRZ48_005696 [Zasmidium cellare]